MFPCWVASFITKSGQPVGGATVTSSLGISATALPTGYCLMVHPAGNFNLTAAAPGCSPATKNNVVMSGGALVRVNFEL